MDRGRRNRAVGARRFGNHPAADGPHTDDVDRNALLACGQKGYRHVARPRLAVRDDDEALGVLDLAEQLLVLVDELHAPVDALFDVRVPGGVVLEPERRVLAEVIEEEEERVRILGEPHLRRDVCAKSASATRSPFQLSASANTRRNCTERRHRSGLTSFTYIDAEPSCRITMSAPDFRTITTRACGRARATMSRLAATMRLSQKARSPKTVNRSRTGSTRACMYRRRVGAPPDHLRDPEDQQHAGDRKQPEIQRLAERQRVEIDAGDHAIILQPAAPAQPLRLAAAALPATP